MTDNPQPPYDPQNPYGFQPPAGNEPTQGIPQPPVAAEPTGGYPQPNPYPQPGQYPPGQYPAGQYPPGPQNEYTQAFKGMDQGFLKTLFSPNFSYFVTPKVVSVLYVVMMAVIALTFLILVIGAFAYHVAAGLLALVLGALYSFLMLVLIRVSLELYVATIQTAQNTRELADKLAKD